MRDLAVLLGLNPSTVSRALDPRKSHLVSQETRLRVLRVAAEADYTPDPLASGLRRRQTLTVGLLVPDLRNATLVDVVRAVTGVLDRYDQTALIAESMDDPARTRRVLERFRGRRVDAVVVLSATESDRAALERMSRTAPVVLAVRRLADATFPTVVCDDVQGGWLVGHHLADLGHRRVVELHGPTMSATFADRSRGFTLACAERSMKIVGKPLAATHATVAEGRRIVHELLQSGRPARPTALFAHNDELALGAFEALRDQGLACPGDMSIVGYNDTPLGRGLAVALTSVHYPALEVGRRAGERAMELLAGNDDITPVIVFDPALVVRASSGPPSSKRVGSQG